MRLPFHDRVAECRHRLGVRVAKASAASRSGANAKAMRAFRFFVVHGLGQLTRPWTLRPAPMPSRTHSSSIGFAQFANQKSSKTNFPFVFPHNHQSHRISDEGLPHKSLAAAPFDLAIVANLAAHQPRRISQQHLAWARQAFRSIKFCGRTLPQSFVGPNVVVDAHPPVAAPLLSSRMARSGSRRFGFVHPMHLFVRAILLRMARRCEFAPYSQSRPPGTQARKPRWAARSEWSPIVHANNFGIPIPREESHKNPANGPPTLIGQQTDSQQITTEQIAHRQRLHSATVLSSKPAFEIERPNLIALFGHGQAASLQPRTSGERWRARRLNFIRLSHLPIVRAQGTA